MGMTRTVTTRTVTTHMAIARYVPEIVLLSHQQYRLISTAPFFPALSYSSFARAARTFPARPLPAPASSSFSYSSFARAARTSTSCTLATHAPASYAPSPYARAARTSTSCTSATHTFATRAHALLWQHRRLSYARTHATHAPSTFAHSTSYARATRTSTSHTSATYTFGTRAHALLWQHRRLSRGRYARTHATHAPSSLTHTTWPRAMLEDL